MLRIQQTIRQNSNAIKEQDVINVKQALNETGHYETPDYGLTPYPDRQLFDAIKSFQGDKNLNVDGIMKPDGETIKSLNDDLKETPEELTFRCKECGAHHGGSKGDICPDCNEKT